MIFPLSRRPAQLAGWPVLASLIVAGCGGLESTKSDYRNATRARPLDVPPELSAPARDDRYTVSEVGSKGTSYSSYLAERSSSPAKPEENVKQPVAWVLARPEMLRFERAGGQRWLVMPASTDEAWRLMKTFVTARGLVIESENTDLGLIETAWTEKPVFVPQDGLRGIFARSVGSRYASHERHRYRIRVEAGVQPGTSEIYVGHRAVEEVFVSELKDTTRWQPMPGDPGMEVEFLGHFLLSAGVAENKVASVSAAGQAAETDRARFEEADGKLALVVDDRFDRAWRRVGLALDRNGFAVDDRDRATGVYFVRNASFDPTATKKSWLDSLAFWRDDGDKAANPASVFRIRVSASGDDSSRVEIQDKSGTPLADTAARKILTVVRNELK